MTRNTLPIALRTLVAVLLTIILAAPADASERKKTPNPCQFEITLYDFGTIKDSSPEVIQEFEFTNTSDKPMMVVNAVASCGCTRPTYTTSPIAPGEKGTVRVKFIPVGQRGFVSKEIKVYFTDGKKKYTTVLRLEGTVIPE